MNIAGAGKVPSVDKNFHPGGGIVVAREVIVLCDMENVRAVAGFLALTPNFTNIMDSLVCGTAGWIRDMQS